ncbi:MAG TPA: alpha/beta hydrolase, partial [Quisquiliibacterium sp.]|nr:alpha/beta hydrolase [Quisquiliibacterium sp.]
MPLYRCNGIELEAEILAAPAAPAALDRAGSSGPVPVAPGGASPILPGDPLPILLIMGLGMQLTAWPAPLVEGLNALGHAVIRFDNRDVGLSTRRAEWGRPNLVAMALRQAIGLPVHATYTLDDMAADTVGLLDALGVARAHVLGVSMGGMIGQLLAARHGDRVASFTCVMSSSGARYLPGPTARARRALLSRPRDPHDHDALVDHFVQVYRAIGSPGYPTPEPQLREHIAVGIRRAVHPLGFVRQLAAIAASGDRSRLLRDITAPTTILHGRADPLVPVAAAHDLARKIPGAELRIVDGMGHDLPDPLLPTIVEAVRDTIARAP